MPFPVSLLHTCPTVHVLCMCVCRVACLCVYIYVDDYVHFCMRLLSVWKENCIFCIAKCKMPHCRERDYAFVSRAYTDVWSCPTNVTSHNPEKLHQSHLITHIHDAVLHSAGSILLLQATELRDMAEWKGFQSTDSVRLRHKHQPDNTTSMPIFFMIWAHYRRVESFLLFFAVSHIATACSMFKPHGNF